MKDMVYAKGSQVTPDEEKKKSPLSVITMVTAAVAAFDTLAATDLGATAQKICDTIKSPVLTALVVGAFVFWTLGGIRE